MNILIYAGIILVGLIVMGLIVARLYRRATKERAFVRTGLGGQKVVLNGGAIVMPVFHEVLDVNLNTLKLSVSRRHEEALISADRLRVDVTAEFYLRVKPDAESVATAAQTLGSRTLNPESLRDLVEGKFIDALRSVAAGMDMDDMHIKRADFVQKVQETVAKDLETNGLELESVSLTGLDQTDLSYFNDSNAFDAVGRAKIVAIVEDKRFETNEIEATNRVKIAETNRKAREQELTIEQGVEFAEIEQRREIDNRRAAQESDVARIREENNRISEEARITNNLDVKRREIESARDLEISEQERKIVVAQKSEEESKARASADKARADAIREEEGVSTAKLTAIADREKSIALVEASQEAEKEAIKVRVSAEADRDAATARAEAKREEARADADAETLRADGIRAVALAEAEGTRAKNEAINLLGSQHLLSQERTVLMEHLPSIIEAAGRPIEKIDGITIANVSGLGGEGGSGRGLTEGGMNGGGGSASLADEVTSAALRYQTAQPLIASILDKVGIKGGSLGDMASTTFAAPVLSREGAEKAVSTENAVTVPVKEADAPNTENAAPGFKEDKNFQSSEKPVRRRSRNEGGKERDDSDYPTS